MARRSRAKRRFGFMKKALVAVLFLASVFYVGSKAIEIFGGAPDFAGPGEGNVQIKVENGDSIARIGNTLKAAGVVKSVDAFTAAAARNPDSSKISPGLYNMMQGMSAKDAVNRLLDPDWKIVARVTIPEGKRATEVFGLLSTALQIPVAQFEAIAQSPNDLPLPQYANGNVEGFLFPATYEFQPGVTALEVMQAMVDKFNSVSKQLDFEAQALAFGKSPYEMLTVASILEGEGHPRDFAKVAQVVYNRLALPMRLQFDSTVNYGLGKADVILTTKLLNTPTPYNSYLNEGLPPTPIGNPGLASMTASLNPEPGDWIYFVTTNLATKETKFTSSYSEFLVFKDELLAYCAAKPETCY